MADNILTYFGPSGLTLYGTVEAEDGTIWNGTALEAYDSADYGFYDVAITESPADSGRYPMTFPAAAAGTYLWSVKQQTQGAPCEGDAVLHREWIAWDGTGVIGVTTAAKTGYKLASDGLDSVVIETGCNARQALAIIGAATAGKIAGAGGTTVTICGLGVPTTTRIVATVDSNGNRPSLSLTLPT